MIILDSVVSDFIYGFLSLDSFFDLTEARQVKLDDAGWTALIAHFLDLHELPGVDPSTGKIVDKDALKNAIKRLPNVGIDLDTGEVTAEAFAKSRGLSPRVFEQALKKYKDRAQRYRKTAEYRRIMRGVLKPKAEFLAQRVKPGRRLDPKTVLKRVKVAAEYLAAKEKDPSLTAVKYAKGKDFSASFLSSALSNHRREAEAYKGLVDAGEEVGKPETRVPTSDEERQRYKEGQARLWKPIILELALAIFVGQKEGIPVRETIRIFAHRPIAKRSMMNITPEKLYKAWRKYKEVFRNEIADYIGDESKKAQPKQITRTQRQPWISKEQQTPTRASIESAWLDLALAVEKRGLTRRLIIEYADLVGVDVIKKIRRFPPSWGDEEIKNWMASHAETYVREAGPRIESELRRRGLWNPPEQRKTATKSATTGTLPKKKNNRPWTTLEGWTKSRKPRVTIAGGVKHRLLRAHPWIDDYFDVSFIELGKTAGRTAGGVDVGKADLVLVMTGFIGHSDAENITKSAPESAEVAYTFRGKPLKSIHSAALELKDKGKAPWFVDAYEQEKGPLNEALYEMLESINLERLLFV